MAPPFLAYYGASVGDVGIIEEAVNQCGLYRDILQNDSGLWNHIVANDSSQDIAPWSTSNGWAAAGMARVLATVMRTDILLPPMKDPLIARLQCWIQEIIDASILSPVTK